MSWMWALEPFEHKCAVELMTVVIEWLNDAVGSHQTIMSPLETGGCSNPRLHRRRPGTSCSLLTRHHAQAATVLDHPRALPQGDRRAGPAFAGSAIGGERNLIVLDAGDVFDDAFAVRCPRIDAEGEVSSGFHRHFFLRHSSS